MQLGKRAGRDDSVAQAKRCFNLSATRNQFTLSRTQSIKRRPATKAIPCLRSTNNNDMHFPDAQRDKYLRNGLPAFVVERLPTLSIK